MTNTTRNCSATRVLVAGVDGYIGWPAAQYLAARGYIVGGVDNYLRRRWVREMGSVSALPVAPIEERLSAFSRRFGHSLPFWEGDLREYSFAERVIGEFQPDAIVHLAQCPSAPFSMLDVEHALLVQTNNLVTTSNLLFAVRALRPECHLVKVGSIREYGAPNISIPEGSFEVAYRDREDRLPFPRQPDSWYGWSEVYSSSNLMFACRNSGLRVTNLMPGIILGASVDEKETDDRLKTRLDFDEAFGTVANRFCCQAVAGHPLTLFGTGNQKRTFLSLRDMMQGLRLVIEHPSSKGEYGILHHFSDTFTLTELALKVGDIAREFGFRPDLLHCEDPRAETETSYYHAQLQGLFALGYWPERDVESELRLLLQGLLLHRDRIRSREHVLTPDVHWSGLREKIRPLPQRAAAAAV